MNLFGTRLGRHVGGRFGSLYWRLTVSYFLVALVAVLIVTAYTAISPSIASGFAPASSPLDALGDKTSVPELASYMEQTSPDRDGMVAWAWSTLVGVRVPLGSVTLAQILDVAGQPIASVTQPAAPTQALASTPEVQAVLHAAMAGDEQPADLHRTLADGQTVLAIPIVADERGPSTRVVGVFLAICTGKSFPATKIFSYWLSPYLTQQPPNQQALWGWLQAVTRNADTPAQGVAAAPSALVVQVLDAAGQPLVSAAAPDVAPQALLATTQAQAAVHDALAGHARSTDPVQVAGRTVVVQTLSVRDYDGRMLGAVAAAYTPSTNTLSLDLQAVWSELLKQLSTGFVFLLLATLVGTLTGALVTLTLRRRLRRVTQAADAWSKGDLAAQVVDRSRDEIGQVARQLNAMARQLQTLLTTREALAVVEERNRLARDLHDSVKQHVFAIALLVRSARKQLGRDAEPAANHLAEAESLAAHTQQELATLIRALRPAALADRGLAAVLRGYVGDWSRRTGIVTELRVQGERATPLDAEEALLRVAQEALANVARHSQATAVQLRLTWDGSAVTLTLQDNGQGFDVARAEGTGLGLASMRERVAALGGTLTVNSAPGSTRVAASVPAIDSQIAEPQEAVNG